MTRVDALGRLGGPVVECGECFTKIMEHEAFRLRRLWIDKEAGSQTRAERLFYYACSRECAERKKAWADTLGGDSTLWIDDAHLAPEDHGP